MTIIPVEVLILLIRLALSGVFGIAGLAKLLDPAGSEKAVSDFGVPKTLVRPVAVLLPIIELVIAGFLLFPSVSWYAAMSGAFLLAAFTVAMLIQLAKGNAPDCHCFGQIHRDPVGVSSIVRNIILLTLSGYLVIRGQGEQGMGLISSENDILLLVIGAAAITLLFAGVNYLKQISEQQVQIMRRIELLDLVAQEGNVVERQEAGHPHEGLPIGSIVPNFEVGDLDGNKHRFNEIAKGGMPILLIYVSPTCEPCKSLVPSFEEWRKELEGQARFVFITIGEADENREKFGDVLSDAIFIQNGREVTDLLRMKWTPTAVLIGSDGRIAGHAAAGDSAIADMLSWLKEQKLLQSAFYLYGHDHVGAKKVGEIIPDFSVIAIDGELVSSDDLKGKHTLALFWSVACPHCHSMADDLRKWDTSREAGEPGLIVFTDGEIQEAKGLGLKSPVIIDEGHKTAGQLGMFGTPSAVLIDEDGRIISETGIGAPDFWAFVGRRP